MSLGWKPWKRYREHPLLLGLLPRVGTLLLRCLFRSLRVTYVGREILDRLIHEEGRQVVAAFWHGRLLMMPLAYPKIPWAIMVSRHPDGEYITRVAERFGIRVIRGSTRRGGRSAFFGMVRAYRQGCHLAITPDGPTGPKEEVKRGTIDLARLTGAPIVPAAFGASRGKFLRSWDRFLIPYPFSRMVFVCGEPIWLRSDASPEDLEKARVLLEERLRQVTAAADAYF